MHLLECEQGGNYLLSLFILYVVFHENTPYTKGLPLFALTNPPAFRCVCQDIASFSTNFGAQTRVSLDEVDKKVFRPGYEDDD